MNAGLRAGGDGIEDGAADGRPVFFVPALGRSTGLWHRACFRITFVLSRA
jgi:hypothetical protein